MTITKEMQEDLARKARAANKRLERASEGQRRALEHYTKGYHTFETAKGDRFRQGKAKTETEYKQRLQELEDFLSGETSTRKGWEALKKRNIEAANRKLKDMGYYFTDEELANVLEEASPKDANFYHVLNIVQAYRAAGAQLDEETIIEALTSRVSEYKATLAAIKARR